VQLLLQHSLSLTLFLLQLSEQQVILTHLSLQLQSIPRTINFHTYINIQ
jgi:hypothetical protein